jgi:hypothetical protein
MRKSEMTMDFYPTIDVSALEAEAIARGLYTVALVDGVHERELALISDLYRSVVDEGGVTGAAALSTLERANPLEPAELAPLLPGSAHRELFVKSTFLLAWADGRVSPAERTKIAEFGKALGVPTERQAELEAEVKDFLLRPLARLANVDAATQIAKKLGV